MLPIEQLLHITISVAPLLDREKVAAWTSLNLFESVVVTTLYLRQNATEDFIAAIFDVSPATVSRRTALEQPIAAALADLKPVPAELTRVDTVLVDGALLNSCSTEAKFTIRESRSPHRPSLPQPQCQRYRAVRFHFSFSSIETAI